MNVKDSMNLKKTELLAPAGSLWKLKTAILYGADAVYCGFDDLNLRVRAENFSFEQMQEGIEFAHERHAKVYIALNSFLFEDDLDLFRILAKKAALLSPDAVILSDPAAVLWFKENAAEIDIHLSTQTGCMNSVSSEFWRKNGVKRIIYARELSLNQLSKIKKNTACEIEVFVHGAMCSAVSGRCLMSSYLASREADQGDCQQPCRWVYSLKDVKGDGKEFPAVEDESGTTIFSAKDLCLFDYLPELINIGIDGLKIEGRIKTDFYVACVTRAYRNAIDTFFANPDGYKVPERWKDELFKISHREYSTGFLFGKEKITQTYLTEAFIRNTIFKGVVVENPAAWKNGLANIIVKETLSPGDEMEAVTPEGDFNIKILKLFDTDGEEIFSGEPGQSVFALTDTLLKPFTFLRKYCPPPFLRI